MDEIENLFKLISIAVPKLGALSDVAKLKELIGELSVNANAHYKFVEGQVKSKDPIRIRKKLSKEEKEADGTRKLPIPNSIVLASKHQSEMKSVNQCASMAVLLASEIKPEIKNWDTRFIDGFMEQADSMHKNILKEKQLKMGSFLDGSDFKGAKVTLMSRNFTVKNVTSTNAFVNDDQSLEVMGVSFEKQIEDLLGENEKALMVAGKFCIAMMKSEENYFIFDSHACNRFSQTNELGHELGPASIASAS
jgi:hypothetical protein